MEIESTAAPTSKRISGTLHLRGDNHPAHPVAENLRRQKALEGEVAGRHKNSRQKDDEDVR